MPAEFMPPEAYTVDGLKRPLEGTQFDLWCLSILSIEVFTGKYLSRAMPDEVCCWSDFVYPALFKIMKKKHFKKEFRRAFPSCKIKNETLKDVRNFSGACLRISPQLRPSTDVLLHHELWKDGGFKIKKDKIWKKRVKSTVMKNKIKNINFFFEIIEPVASKSVSSQTVIHETNDDNGETIRNERNNVSKSDVAIQVDLDQVNMHNEDDRETSVIEVRNATMNDTTNEVDPDDFCSEFVNNEDTSRIEVEDAVKNEAVSEINNPEVINNNVDNKESNNFEVEKDLGNIVIIETNVISKEDVIHYTDTENKDHEEAHSIESYIEEEKHLDNSEIIENSVTVEEDVIYYTDTENKDHEEANSAEVKNAPEIKVHCEVNIHEDSIDKVTNKEISNVEEKNASELSSTSESNNHVIDFDNVDKEKPIDIETENVPEMTFISEPVHSETIAVKKRKRSSRFKGFGYNIASKFFKFFI